MRGFAEVLRDLAGFLRGYAEKTRDPLKKVSNGVRKHLTKHTRYGIIGAERAFAHKKTPRWRLLRRGCFILVLY